MRQPINFFSKAYTLAVPTLGGGQRFNAPFPDVAELRGKTICGMNSAVGTATTWIDGRSVITAGVELAAWVSLVDNMGIVFVEDLPLRYFNAQLTQTSWKYFSPSRVLSLPKCFITFSGTVGQQVVPITFFYE